MLLLKKYGIYLWKKNQRKNVWYTWSKLIQSEHYDILSLRVSFSLAFCVYHVFFLSLVIPVLFFCYDLYVFSFMFSYLHSLRHVSFMYNFHVLSIKFFLHIIFLSFSLSCYLCHIIFVTFYVTRSFVTFSLSHTLSRFLCYVFARSFLLCLSRCFCNVLSFTLFLSRFLC